jgi:hypothetical protein
VRVLGEDLEQRRSGLGEGVRLFVADPLRHFCSAEGGGGRRPAPMSGERAK